MMNDDHKTKKQLVNELTELRSQNAALKKSESAEKYRTLVENIRDVIYELDSQGVVLYISPTIRDLLGYESAEIVGKNFITLAHEDDLSSLQEWFSELRKGVESPSEYRIIDKSGEYKWAQTRVRPIIESGQFKGARGILIDVTAQKLVEQALQESEKKYRLVVDNMMDVITVMDLNLRFTYVSPSVIRLREYTDEEVMGQSLETIMTPESLQIAVRVLEEELKLEAGGLADPNRTRILELEEYRKDGSTVWLENHLSPFRDQDKKLMGIIALSYDITNRKQVEEQLKRTNIFLDSIIENIPDMIFLKDARDLRFIRFNRAGEELMGYSRDDLLGKSDYDLFPKEQADHFTEMDRKALRSKEVMNIPEESLQTRNKGERIVHTKKVPLLDAKGEPKFLLGISEDITERKRAEESIRQSEIKYRHLHQSMMDAFVSVDMEGHINDYNESYLDMLGYMPEDICKLTYKDITPEKWHKIEAAIVQKQILIKGYSDIYEKEYRRKDGTVFPVELRTSLLRDDAGLPMGMWAIARDITQRKRQEEESEKVLLWRQSLNLLQQSLLAPAPLEEKLRVVTDGIVNFFGADFARIWLIQPGDLCEQGCIHADIVDKGHHICRDRVRCLHLLASSGRYTHIDGEIHRRVPFGCYKIGRVASDEEHKFLTNDVQNDPLIHNHEWARELGLVSFVGYQLRVPGRETIGVMALFAKHPISSVEDAILDGLSSAVALVIQRSVAEKSLNQTLESLRRAIHTTIQVMVSAVEIRDPYTAGHQSRSADLARAIATEMGLSQDRIQGIRMAGSIHDIGKLSIPAEILSKPTRLTNIEFSLIKEHSRSGYEMLKDMESPWPLAQIVYQHHERMDGSGYPRNLKGNEILMEARIMAVADVVESMASHRPYRAALGIDAAMEEIEKNKGTLYDNTVADVCLRLFREKSFQFERT